MPPHRRRPRNLPRIQKKKAKVIGGGHSKDHNRHQHGAGRPSHLHANHSNQTVHRSKASPEHHSGSQASSPQPENVSELISKMEAGEGRLLVVSRVRPLADDERRVDGRENAIVAGNNMVVLLDPNDDGTDVLRAHRSREKRYTFDLAFGPKATQNEIYEGSCKFLLPGLLQGFNATVFAYGPTGAGKTFTMVGKNSDPGVMVSAIAELFQLISNSAERYNVKVSYVEIYNECLRDLLVVDSPDLDLREDKDGNSIVCGLKRCQINSAQDMALLLNEGNTRRTQEATAANRTSSRSHAVLEVVVEHQASSTNTKTIQTGRLFLIDLAGSERAANTGNTGIRMVEGQHINRSLLALGNCINSLGGRNRDRYVNYRDSKLTRMLKDSLNGNCRTVMIACASPSAQHFEETYNTMNYAKRAKNIKTRVTKNVSTVEMHITEYLEIIANLKKEVSQLKGKLVEEGEQKEYQAASGKPSTLLDEKGTPLLERIEEALNAHKAASEEMSRLGGGTSSGEVSPLGSALSGEDLDQRRMELMDALHNRKEATERLYGQALKMALTPEQTRLVELMFQNHRLELQLLEDANSSRSTEVIEEVKTAVSQVLKDARDLRDQIIDQQRSLLGHEGTEMSPELTRLYQALEELRARETLLPASLEVLLNSGIRSGPLMLDAPPTSPLFEAKHKVLKNDQSAVQTNPDLVVNPSPYPISAMQMQGKPEHSPPPLPATNEVDAPSPLIATTEEEAPSPPLITSEPLPPISSEVIQRVEPQQRDVKKNENPVIPNIETEADVQNPSIPQSVKSASKKSKDSSVGDHDEPHPVLPVQSNEVKSSEVKEKLDKPSLNVLPKTTGKKKQKSPAGQVVKSSPGTPSNVGSRLSPPPKSVEWQTNEQNGIDNTDNNDTYKIEKPVSVSEKERRLSTPIDAWADTPGKTPGVPSPTPDAGERPQRYETQTLARHTPENIQQKQLPPIINSACKKPHNDSTDFSDMRKTFTKQGRGDEEVLPADTKQVDLTSAFEARKTFRKNSRHKNLLPPLDASSDGHDTDYSSASKTVKSPASSTASYDDQDPFPSRPVRVGTPVVGMRHMNANGGKRSVGVGLPYRVPIPTAVKQSRAKPGKPRSRHKPPRVAKGRAPASRGGIFELQVEQTPYNSRHARGLRYA
eukprot:m.339864 g.339864  ORF g.339864 m.339864 type:complete len:1156 (+) comp19011_c0_seq1:358-3825(+)